MVFSYRAPKKRKEIKLFTRENSQQAKEERQIFLGFLSITTTTGMESKLAKRNPTPTGPGGPAHTRPAHLAQPAGPPHSP